jgi:hypothetical protein
MLGGPKVRLDKALYEKAKEIAEIAGYPSVDELVGHAVEKLIAELGSGDSEEEIKKRLKGLGYLS